MKNLKIFKQVVIVLLVCLSNSMIGQKTSDTFFENVAIIDVKAVKTNDGKYHYELKLKDFSGREVMPEGFGLKGQAFMDNGKYNDRKANDGIYTAREKIPQKKLTEKPISQTVFYDESFKYINLLPSDNQQRGIGCKFKRCGCPCSTGLTCVVCMEFGWSCWIATECELIFDFNLFK